MSAIYILLHELSFFFGKSLIVQRFILQIVSRIPHHIFYFVSQNSEGVSELGSGRRFAFPLSFFQLTEIPNRESDAEEGVEAARDPRHRFRGLLCGYLGSFKGLYSGFLGCIESGFSDFC